MRDARDRPLRLVRPEPVAAVPVIEARRLGMVFRVDGMARPVLKDVSFEARSGEIVCIIGRSGCGKSTLLGILAGFARPSAGEALSCGRPIDGPGPDRLVVFQDPTLFPWLTVRENIAFGLRSQLGDAEERRLIVDRFLAHVGLEEFGDYLPREISGGMRQRVSLARVLVMEPRALLMDEPFAALDAQTREEMQRFLVAALAERPRTVVFVTHDIEECIKLADRVIIMDRDPGRIREVVEVRAPRPRDEESGEFIRLRRRLRELLRA